MSDQFKEAGQAMDIVYREALHQGIAIGERISAAAVAELREALRGMVARFGGSSTCIQDSMALNDARLCLSKHTPPTELLRDEYPDKYAGLKADAQRVKNEERGGEW